MFCCCCCTKCVASVAVSSDVEQHLKYANQTYGTLELTWTAAAVLWYKMVARYFKFKLGVSKGCTRMRLQYFSKLRLQKEKKIEIAHTCFFFSSSSFPLSAVPSCPPHPFLPLLKAITEIQFLIPPHRSSIDCKQIYIQAVNRKLQRFIYWVWRRETS